MTIEFASGELDLEEPIEVESGYTALVKPHGNGARIRAKKKHRNKRAVVLILES